MLSTLRDINSKGLDVSIDSVLNTKTLRGFFHQCLVPTLNTGATCGRETFDFVLLKFFYDSKNNQPLSTVPLSELVENDMSGELDTRRYPFTAVFRDWYSKAQTLLKQLKQNNKTRFGQTKAAIAKELERLLQFIFDQWIEYDDTVAVKLDVIQKIDSVNHDGNVKYQISYALSFDWRSDNVLCKEELKMLEEAKRRFEEAREEYEKVRAKRRKKSPDDLFGEQ